MTDNITINYKLDKTKTYNIDIPSDSTVQDLLDAVNKKHHGKYIVIYSKNNFSYLENDDLLEDWYTDDDDVFYFSEQREIKVTQFEDEEDTNMSEDEAPPKGKATKKKDKKESKDKAKSKAKSKASDKAKKKAPPKSKEPSSDEEEEITKPPPKTKPKSSDKGKKKTAAKPKEPSSSSSEETTKSDSKPTDISDAAEDPDYPEIPMLAYPSIPTVGKEKPLDFLLQTELKKSFRMDLKPKHSDSKSKKNEFFVYSTKSYDSMTTPLKVKINLDSPYKNVEKEIKKSLELNDDNQIHIFLPTGAPFVKEYEGKPNKLENFFNNVESNHNLYVVITNRIDSKVLNKEIDEICNVKNDTMKQLMCPTCKCTNIGYSRIACLLGTFYYKGLRTNNFIKSVARCTGFAPLVSFLSCILFHDSPITGLMLATVTASLHALFSKLLPKQTPANKVFDRCLECACYIVHIEETYLTEKLKDKKKKPVEIKIDPVDIDNDPQEGVVKYLADCDMSGIFYQYSADLDSAETFELAIIENIPNFREIEDIFNNYASFRPVPPLSTRTLNLTCIIQYVKGCTLLFIGAYDKDDAEETINIIDPFVGEVQAADVEKLADELQKLSGEGIESLIDADEVEELIVILFDTSGSMLSRYEDNKTASNRKKVSKDSDEYTVGDTSRFTIAYQYLTTFLNRSFGYRLPQLISLISFGKEIIVASEFSPLSPNIEAAASQLKIKGQSRVWDAIDLSITKLVDFNKKKKYPNANLRIIVFSDGIDKGSEQKQEEVCQRAIKSKITVDSIILSLVDSCENLCKFSHLTGGYALRSEDIKNVNALFEKEAFLSLKLRPKRDIKKGTITEKIFENADGEYDNDVENFDFITQTHRVTLSTPNYVMSEAKKKKKPIERHELRLLRELKIFQLKNDETIKLFVNSKDINNWKVYMKGPDDSGYADHWWFLSITFSEDYPLHPPNFRFINVPYHLNISEDGRVCASFLFKSYKASYSVYELVEKVKNLLVNPEIESPIQIYKRMLYNDDEDGYNAEIEDSCSMTPESFKECTKGCAINDDKKFKVKIDDFESRDDAILSAATEIKLPPSKGKTAFTGLSTKHRESDVSDEESDNDF